MDLPVAIYVRDPASGLVVDEALAERASRALGVTFVPSPPGAIDPGFYFDGNEAFDLSLYGRPQNGSEDLDPYPVKLVVLGSVMATRLRSALDVAHKLEAAGFQVLVDDELENVVYESPRSPA